MPLHLFIRADANSQVGAGHVMRCLALAEAWQDAGATTCFVGCIESTQLKERILSQG